MQHNVASLFYVYYFIKKYFLKRLCTCVFSSNDVSNYLPPGRPPEPPPPGKELPDEPTVVIIEDTVKLVI